VQVILTFILPYGFINFYPAQLFLGKDDYLFHPSLPYATLPVGLGLFSLAYRFWRYGINRYQGTGS
jgi:ABC-2 type transport system permease protein